MRRIFVVGMMGAGKSTVGKRLAARLGLDFVDADRELEARCGAGIPLIFDIEGEAGFRRREAALLDELTQRDRIVVGTGGGAVLDPGNRAMLSARGLVIYLRATAHELWTRTRRDRNRPLLQTPNPRERIEQLVAERDPLYREVAGLIVDTGRQPVEHVVRAILERLPPELLAERSDA
ncbi:MAG: shikimate kinase [Burkholderiales bacterium]|nr:MAG: shikimate kinase [Burkholderiales bacterium]